MSRVKSITIGYSVLSAYRRCPTYFRNRYLKHLVKTGDGTTYKRGSALDFGTVIHKGLEVYHGSPVDGVPSSDLQDLTTGQPLNIKLSPRDLALSAILSTSNQTSLINVDPEGDRNTAHAIELMNAYADKFPRSGDFNAVIRDSKPALELETSFQLTDRVTWRQRLDGLVQLPDGEVVVLEHKTTSGDPRDMLVDRMLPNAQAVGYSLAASKLLGVPTVNVLFNGLSSDRKAIDPDWVAQYEKKKNKDGTYKKAFDPFLRHKVIIEPWMYDEWIQEVTHDVNNLLSDIESATFGRNAPDACTVFNRRCQYADLCKIAPTSRPHVEEFMYDTEQYDGLTITYEEESK